MSDNGDEISLEATEDGAHNPNSYFEAFAGIVAALDALAKAVTPEEDDDGTPPDEMPASCCNSYFSSFRAIQDALIRLKTATEGRLAELAGAGGMPFVTPAVADGTATLVNKAVNAVALGGTALSLAFPAAVEGQGRSFVVRFTCTAETAWTLPAGVSFESDDDGVFADIGVGETVVLIFSEVADGVFLVSRKTVTSVTKE